MKLWQQRSISEQSFIPCVVGSTTYLMQTKITDEDLVSLKDILKIKGGEIKIQKAKLSCLTKQLSKTLTFTKV